MDVLDSAAPHAGLPVPGQVPIRLVVWGHQPSDHERAIAEAGTGWGRQTWVITRIDRLTDETCPIDADDPDAVAADRQDGWAYGAYPDR